MMANLEHTRSPWRPSLRNRRIVASGLSAAIVSGSFFFLAANRDAALALPFSVGLGALTLLSLRWWTAPVHRGLFCYFSPHTVILFSSLFYFGLLNLPALAFPELIHTQINYSQDYYLPALIYALLGLFIFDYVYRWATRRLCLNDAIEVCRKRFHSPEIQRSIPFLGAFWYLAGPAAFLLLSRRYVMHTFSFVGAESEGANILIQSGRDSISVAVAFLSLMFFRAKSLSLRLLPLALAATVGPILFGYDSRGFFIILAVLTVFCGLLYRTRPLKLRTGLGIVAVLIAGFLIFSSHKIVRRHDPYVARTFREEKNLFRRFRIIFDSPQFLDKHALMDRLAGDLRTREARLDLPAGMIQSRRDFKIPFLYGKHAVDDLLAQVPRLLWPGKSGWRRTPIRDHFQLPRIDQNHNFLSSSYADGGFIGVILGGGALGFFSVAIQKMIFRRRDGILIYLGTFLRIFNFVGTLPWYLLSWFQWTLIVMAVNSILLFIHQKLLTQTRSNPK